MGVFFWYDRSMNEILEMLAQQYQDQPPFLCIGEQGEYLLVGNSKNFTDATTHYDGIGDFKLTPRTHSNTLNALIKFMMIVDALDDKGLLNLDDPETLQYVQWEFSGVLMAYFNKVIDFDTQYSDELALTFLNANKQLINEALYNVSSDRETLETNAKMAQKRLGGGRDQLQGDQFKDPYFGIAVDYAIEHDFKPSEIVDGWSSSMLIVAYFNELNSEMHANFLQHKYSNGKQKPPKPVNQAVFFKEIGEDVEEETQEPTEEPIKFK